MTSTDLNNTVKPPFPLSSWTEDKPDLGYVIEGPVVGPYPFTPVGPYCFATLRHVWVYVDSNTGMFIHFRGKNYTIVDPNGIYFNNDIILFEVKEALPDGSWNKIFANFSVYGLGTVTNNPVKYLSKPDLELAEYLVIGGFNVATDKTLRWGTFTGLTPTTISFAGTPSSKAFYIKDAYLSKPSTVSIQAGDSAGPCYIKTNQGYQLIGLTWSIFQYFAVFWLDDVLSGPNGAKIKGLLDFDHTSYPAGTEAPPVVSTVPTPPVVVPPPVIVPSPIPAPPTPVPVPPVPQPSPASTSGFSGATELAVSDYKDADILALIAVSFSQYFGNTKNLAKIKAYLKYRGIGI